MTQNHGTRLTALEEQLANLRNTPQTNHTNLIATVYRHGTTLEALQTSNAYVVSLKPALGTDVPEDHRKE